MSVAAAPAPAVRKGAIARPRFLVLVTGATFAYMFVPILVVAAFSFNSKRSLSTFGEPSLRWYEQLASNEAALASLKASVFIALVVMVVATVLGTALALATARGRRSVVRPVEGALMLTLVTPEVATAVALLLLLTTLDIGLSNATVMLGHITFSLAYVAIIVRGRLATLRAHIEEAAMDLGANELQTLRLVVLPQLWPAIVGSGLLVFLLSFDDFVTSVFVSGVDVSPLPVRIYSMIRFGITPEVNAIGTLMMVFSVALGLLAFAVLARRQRRIQL